MKFFIPAATDDANAESIYDGIKKFNSSSRPITDRRIYSISWVHETKAGHAEVGQPDSVTHDIVLAILETDQIFYVCTINRGGLRGGPILIGHREVTRIVDFE